MNLLQEIICAVWGCNQKAYFTTIHDRERYSTSYFCSRCKTKLDTFCHMRFYWPTDKEVQEQLQRVEKSNAEMHKKYGYDFKY